MKKEKRIELEVLDLVTATFSVIGTYPKLNRLKKFIDNDKLFKKILFQELCSEQQDFSIRATALSEYKINNMKNKFVLHIRCDYPFYEGVRHIIDQKINNMKNKKKRMAA